MSGMGVTDEQTGAETRPDHPHDHELCLGDALATAEALCAERGVRLTEIRRRVLELVWSGHRAVKAYDLLERLSTHDRVAQPPTVYRALDFLLAQGLVHRIESLNAYVGCPLPNDGHAGHFLICRDCLIVIEMAGEAIDLLIDRAAVQADFEVARRTVEVHGRCARCRKKAGPPC